MGFLSARACLISIWQYGRCSTPCDKNSKNADACSMPFSIPSLVRSAALLSYCGRVGGWRGGDARKGGARAQQHGVRDLQILCLSLTQHRKPSFSSSR